MEQGKDRPRIVIERKLPGDPTVFAELGAVAYGRIPELRRSSLDQFVERLLDSIESVPRVELSLVHAGEVVGGASLVPEIDLHVGPCLSVTWQYVADEYRGLGFTRQVFKVLHRCAKELGLPSIAYTHRTGEGRYTTQYRSVHNGQNSK